MSDLRLLAAAKALTPYSGADWDEIDAEDRQLYLLTAEQVLAAADAAVVGVPEQGPADDRVKVGDPFPCYNAGPRIGENVLYCFRPLGHTGNHWGHASHDRHERPTTWTNDAAPVSATPEPATPTDEQIEAAAHAIALAWEGDGAMMPRLARAALVAALGAVSGPVGDEQTAKTAEELRLLRRVAEHAQRVMDTLEQYGPGIVPHLLDTDDNSGQFLRDALFAARAGLAGTDNKAGTE